MRKVNYFLPHSFQTDILQVKRSLLISLLTFLFSSLLFSQADQKIRVACVGNSVTYGYGIEDREVNSYPAQLQNL